MPGYDRANLRCSSIRAQSDPAPRFLPNHDSASQMMKPPEPVTPESLLRYHPTYAVLICNACRYAIQPSGIARHLKEIHKIYRANRRPYMEYASRFNLATPEQVIGAKLGEFPVRLLPVFSGLRCLGPEGCSHLCVSTKRMQKHWRLAHGKNDDDASEKNWCAAPLQTFFRGNLLHYFTTHDATSDLTPAIQKIDHATAYAQVDEVDHILFSHYLTATYATLADRHAAEEVWQHTIPQMAAHHPFLMHALLACSALHMASQYPSQQQLYILRAHHHQDVAMPQFRKAITDVTETNCHAIMAFSHFLVIYSFAADDANERLLLADPSSPDPDLLCSWLYFIRNGCLLVCDHWDKIETGPLGQLVMSWESPIPGLEDDTFESRISAHLLSLVPDADAREEDEAWPQKVRGIYLEAASQLSWAFAASQVLPGDDFTTWDAVRVWPMTISVAYIELLMQGHAAAIILLAHYSLLLERIQPYWYFCGRAQRLFSTVLDRLDSRWHPRMYQSREVLSSILQKSI